MLELYQMAEEDAYSAPIGNFFDLRYQTEKVGEGGGDREEEMDEERGEEGGEEEEEKE